MVKFPAPDNVAAADIPLSSEAAGAIKVDWTSEPAI
jgi:hypothetical protein